MNVEKNQSILVVEDTAPLREYLRDSLEAQGFKVRACEDGPTALYAATKDVYHVIITDYRMPNMSGVDVTKHLRAKFPAALIIGVSVEDKHKDFLSAGADAFLLKPYRYEDILALIS